MDLFAPWHILVIVIAMLLLFGGKKIPEMMGGIGKGVKEFKKSMKDEDEKPKDVPKEIPKSENLRDRLKE